MQKFYRFRPLNITDTKHVVQELQDHEIYLATLEENNDPMDGFQDVYWDGDEPLWRNLIYHYCLCLIDSFNLIRLQGNEEDSESSWIRTRLTLDDFTSTYQDTIKYFQQLVDQDSHIQQIIEIIIDKKRLNKEELTFLLVPLHNRLLPLFEKTVKKHFNFDLALPSEIFSTYTQEVYTTLRETSNDNLRLCAEIQAHSQKQLKLLSFYPHFKEDEKSLKIAINYSKLLVEFPAIYLEDLVNKIHFEYYLASFSKINDDPTMWSHYAQDHRGICLVFEFDEINNTNLLTLTRGNPLKLTPVEYHDSPPSFNFFKALGYLTLHKITSFWLNHKGLKSELTKLYNDNDYLKKYWKINQEKMAHKFCDWKQEKEYRVTKDTMFTGPQVKNCRIYNYNLKHLKGIIFGHRTTIELKIKILNTLDDILTQKMKKSFKFYQATYSTSQRKLVVSEMSLITFADK